MSALESALLSRNESLFRHLLSLSPDDSASYQDEASGRSLLMIAASLGLADSVSVLLQRGAPWNAIDRMGKCAGNYALENGQQVCVEALVSAGVASELVFGEISNNELASAPRNIEYLNSQAVYNEDQELLEENTKDAVMMEWERPLMEAHAGALCSAGAKRVLNIGFGMGIVDECFQSYNPERHVVSEAHPDVIKEMQKRGWLDKPNVFVVQGRWQDRISEIIQLGPYDAVFFDTFGEHLDDLREFHKQLPNLLSESGAYSFFNGMCPNNVFFQGVACEVVRLDLKNLGLDCEFHRIDCDAGDDQVWKNVARRYFNADEYFMPLAKRSLASAAEEMHRRDRRREAPGEVAAVGGKSEKLVHY